MKHHQVIQFILQIQLVALPWVEEIQLTGDNIILQSLFIFFL